MPYIKKEGGRREALRNGDIAQNAGELNYQIFYYVKHTRIKFGEIAGISQKSIKRFVDQFLGEKPNYQRYNDMTGCLLRCSKEIDRRIRNVHYSVGDLLLEIMDSYDEEIENYEDVKIKENGDVL